MLLFKVHLLIIEVLLLDDRVVNLVSGRNRDKSMVKSKVLRLVLVVEDGVVVGYWFKL